MDNVRQDVSAWTYVRRPTDLYLEALCLYNGLIYEVPCIVSALLSQVIIDRQSPDVCSMTYVEHIYELSQPRSAAAAQLECSSVPCRASHAHVLQRYSLPLMGACTVPATR